MLGIGFLVSPAPGLPLHPMFLKQPPERFAILVMKPPLALQIIARIFHSGNVSLAHRSQQALPRLGRDFARLPDWLLLSPIAFPEAG